MVVDEEVLARWVLLRHRPSQRFQETRAVAAYFQAPTPNYSSQETLSAPAAMQVLISNYPLQEDLLAQAVTRGKLEHALLPRQAGRADKKKPTERHEPRL